MRSDGSCASPSYLEQFGEPKHPEDLANHRCIVFTAAGRGRWAFKTASGGVEQRDVSATFATDSHDCMLQLALHGAGIARLADFQVARPIKSGTLVPLLAAPIRDFDIVLGKLVGMVVPVMIACVVTLAAGYALAAYRYGAARVAML